MAGSDFVFVQLTAEGALQAGGHPLRVSGRVSVQFTPGQPTRVAQYEWDLMLKNYETTSGLPLFELVPAPPASAAPAPAQAAPNQAANKTPAATPTTTPAATPAKNQEAN